MLRACAEADVAVVPFGGGTSVVGGLEAAREGFAGVVSLDLGRMDAVVSVDERSLTAVLEPGLRLPEADRALRRARADARARRRRATSGRRSAAASRRARPGSPRRGTGGSTRTSSRCAARRRPGTWRRSACRRRAAGPALRELVVGSEGALGVHHARSRCACARCPRRGATRAGSRARSRTAATRCASWSRRGWRPTSRGCPTRRRRGSASRWPAAAAPPGARAGRPRRALGYGEGCLLVLGWEGPEAAGAAPARRRRMLLRRGGRAARGPRPGRGVGGDALRRRRTCATTCSTAACSWRRSRRRRRWSALLAVRDAVTAALSGALGRAVVGCHVSHLYPTGASLYFTVLAARDPDDPRGQWQRAKAAAARRDRRRRRHDHPPPRRRPRPRAVAGGRARPARRRAAARGQGALRPRGDHEPGRAPAARRSAESGRRRGPGERQLAAGWSGEACRPGWTRLTIT